MKKYFCIIFFFCVTKIIAQTAVDEQLAQQFFEMREYDKAIVYFEKLYAKNQDIYYPQYFKCLLATHDFKKAEKTVKKQLKNLPDVLALYVDLGQVFEADSNRVKAAEQYNKAIKELNGDVNQVLQLGKAFTNVKEYDYALETYKKGRRQNNKSYPFFYELADVYKSKGDLKSMINEYLDAIDYRETELSTVQILLQNNLGYDDEKGGFNNPVLKQELQKRLASNPDKGIFCEFLIYILLQQKDFEAAFIQAKALDKRKKDDGFRLMELGKICVSNESFDVAQQCFDYVISKGKENFNYQQACTEAANAQFEKIIRQQTYTPGELTELEQKLKNTIKEFGYSQFTTSVVHKLALLQGFYLNKPEEAVTMLNEVILNPGIDKNKIAELKLDLGDLLLITGDVWEASLTYSQVEKAFKFEPIGQEAKFRNAKVAYYMGDFTWAKSQLDVLKGATSKLIANDAMDLSLVISDAIGIDTNADPLKMFASADLLLLQHKTNEALARLDSINILYEKHSLADDIYFKKGQIFMKLGKYKEAIDAYQRVVDVYGDEIYGDDAMFRLAEIYQFKLQDLEKAKALYQEFLSKYPASVFTIEARKRFRKLRGDVVN
ncbi:MAG TPA: tetratricopeptide repeat protein [Bacteroidia bacterium]|nr:tetratricopeptide repeat protein [Bacteroidia bacterium]